MESMKNLLSCVFIKASLETMMSTFIFDTVFSQEVAGTFPAEGLVEARQKMRVLCCELLEYK